MLTSGMDSPLLPFAFLFAPDAYSMAGKIMGRQSAGHSLLKAVAAVTGTGLIKATGPVPSGEAALRDSLRAFESSAQLRWHHLHKPETLSDVGALYCAAPPLASIAALRNSVRPMAFSCFGVTHTLASEAAMAQLAALTLPPFKSWDALICTSHAARAVFETIRSRVRETYQREIGATYFPDVQAPVIPLGVDTDAFTPCSDLRATMRRNLNLGQHDVMLLSAGRLTFHAKFNPAPLYRALAALPAKQRARLVLVEAGIYPNAAIAAAYRAAQEAFMPDVRIQTVDGRQREMFDGLWHAADIFISLSDNVQETFGLTPVEAMAAGLPVIATDWDGYRDTVRHGRDGFLIPTLMAAPGHGIDLARRYAAGIDNFDMYIGRLSLAAMVDHAALSSAIATLVADDALRAKMGSSGRARACAEFDWKHILRRYTDLCGQLADLRQKAIRDEAETAPERPDPFALFSAYPTRHLAPTDRIMVRIGAEQELAQILTLSMTSFALDDETLPAGVLLHVLRVAALPYKTVGDLVAAVGEAPAIVARALLWLAKFGLIEIFPVSSLSENASCAGMAES